MTDVSRPGDDIAALRESIATLTARLDRIETQPPQPSTLDSAEARLTGAWDALRGNGKDPASPSTGRLWTVLTVCAILVALILAVELADEVFDGLWHLGHWLD